MTQPPYGERPQPAEAPSPYPQQALLPQQVQPRRSRLPRVLMALAVVAAVVAGLVIWRVVHDHGERNRQAYCATLSSLTGGGSLLEAARRLGPGVPAALQRLRTLAPDSVRGEWDDLAALMQSAPTSQLDLGSAARALTDVRAIISDANSSCGMNIRIPG